MVDCTIRLRRLWLMFAALCVGLIVTGCEKKPPPDPTHPKTVAGDDQKSEQPQEPPPHVAPPPERPRPPAVQGPHLEDVSLVELDGNATLKAQLVGAAPRAIALEIRYHVAAATDAPLPDTMPLQNALTLDLGQLGKGVLGTASPGERKRFRGPKHTAPLYVLVLRGPESVARLAYISGGESDHSAEEAEDEFSLPMRRALSKADAAVAALAGLASVASALLAPGRMIYAGDLPRLVSVRGVINDVEKIVYPGPGPEAKAPAMTPELTPPDGYRVTLPATETARVDLHFQVQQQRLEAWSDRFVLHLPVPYLAPAYVELRLPSHTGRHRRLAVMAGADGVASFESDAQESHRRLALLNARRKRFEIVSRSGNSVYGHVYLRSGRAHEINLDTQTFAVATLPAGASPDRILQYVRADLLASYDDDFGIFRRLGVEPPPLRLKPAHAAVLEAADWRDPAIVRFVRRYAAGRNKHNRSRRQLAQRQADIMNRRPPGQWSELDAAWILRGLAVDDATDSRYTASVLMMVKELAERVEHNPEPTVTLRGAGGEPGDTIVGERNAVGAHAAAVLSLLKGAGLFRGTPQLANRLLRLARVQGDLVLGDHLRPQLEALGDAAARARLLAVEKKFLADEPLALVGAAFAELHRVTGSERYREAGTLVRRRLAEYFIKRHGVFPLRWEIEVAALFLADFVPYYE